MTKPTDTCAITKGTAGSWRAWLSVLNEIDAASMPHAEITRRVREKRERSMSTEQAPPVHLPVARLMDGYLTTQLLCIAAKLNIADAVADEPQTAEALARRTCANPGVLRRVLRGLAAEGVLDECSDGRFVLGVSGTCLRSDVPGSLRAAIIARGELYYGAAGGLFDATGWWRAL